jgi:hemerythrin superfamily protein
MRYGKIWEQELDNIRKYSESKDIDQNVRAFYHLLQNGSEKELEEVFSSLKSLENDSLSLTKKMLEIGKQYNEDVFKDVYEAGGIRELKKKYEQKIDKLKKDLLKYENNEEYSTSSSYKLPNGSGAGINSESDVSLGGILNRSRMGIRR